MLLQCSGIMMSFEDTIAAVLDGRLAPLRLELQRLAAEVSDLRQALPPLLVSVPIAAERLGVSLSTARRRVRDGEWPVRRDGRRVLVDLGTLHAKTNEELSDVSRSLRSDRVARGGT